jgi:hypothetical protein
MSTYTPALVRAYIDDLDAVFRAAVVQGTLKETLGKEMSRLVSSV